MINQKFILRNLMIGIVFAFGLVGCASVESAYKSAADTVSGWFKTEEKSDSTK